MCYTFPRSHLIKLGEFVNNEQKIKRVFLSIPHAAELAGFSVRHFRRILEEEKMRIVQIGHKFFILVTDFERWQNSKRNIKC